MREKQLIKFSQVEQSINLNKQRLQTCQIIVNSLENDKDILENKIAEQQSCDHNSLCITFMKQVVCELVLVPKKQPNIILEIYSLVLQKLLNKKVEISNISDKKLLDKESKKYILQNVINMLQTTKSKKEIKEVNTNFKLSIKDFIQKIMVIDFFISSQLCQLQQLNEQVYLKCQINIIAKLLQTIQKQTNLLRNYYSAFYLSNSLKEQLTSYCKTPDRRNCNQQIRNSKTYSIGKKSNLHVEFKSEKVIKENNQDLKEQINECINRTIELIKTRGQQLKKFNFELKCNSINHNLQEKISKTKAVNQKNLEVLLSIRNQSIKIPLSQIERQNLLNAIQLQKQNQIIYLISRILEKRFSSSFSQQIRASRVNSYDFIKLKQDNSIVQVTVISKSIANHKPDSQENCKIYSSMDGSDFYSQKDNAIQINRNQNKAKLEWSRMSQQQNVQYSQEYLSFSQNQKQIMSYENKILGGGGCASSCIKGNQPSKTKVHNQRDDIEKVKGLQNDEFFKERLDEPVEDDGVEAVDCDNFEKAYKDYFKKEIISNVVKKNIISSQVRKIIEKAMYDNREEIVYNSIRERVIDLVNLVINYLLISFQKKSVSSLQRDIDDLNSKLILIQQYCYENRERYPCLDLHLYIGILISMNSLRQGLDKANQSLTFKIAEKLIQLVKVGSGFVSIAGAIKSLTEVNLNDLKQFIKEVKEIIKELTPSTDYILSIGDTGQQMYNTYKNGSLFQQIYTLWIRKTEAMGENLEETHTEIIFYLKELSERNIKNEDMIKFILMQINYLLEKEYKNDKLKQLSSNLMKQEEIIMNFFNELLIKKYSTGVLDYIKSLASLITSSEQFRYLQASILLKFALIIKHHGDKKLEQSVMINLCLNYIQEKQISVKIVYKDNQMMREFIHNIKEYEQEIINQQGLIKTQMTMFVDEEKINKISENISNKEDISKQLANTLIQMWEISVRQRQDRNQIAHKDDALLEAVKLYISQQITYQGGNNIFTDQKQDGCQTVKNAINQIIEHFLIPNYQLSSSDNQENEQQQNKKQCKILSLLAEGGTGKSMLLKKLEVELIKHESEFIKDKRAQYIPLIIKCNSLDIKEPSIEKFLESQNLNQQQIESLKTSERNKLIMLDGYDEYAGDYFKVFHKLKIFEWVNTLVIVTSRLEKISVSDAQVYFNYYDIDGKQGDSASYSVVKLEKFSDSDIKDYLSRFEVQLRQTDKNFKEKEYKLASDMIFKNKGLIKLLKLPINLYLMIRMMVDMNLKDENTLNTFQKASDQVEIQELFFQNQFFKKSSEFIKQISIDGEKKSRIIQELVQSSYFEYFQSIAMKMFLQKGVKDNFLSTDKKSINFQLRQEVKDHLDESQYQTLQNLLDKFVDSRVITRIKLSDNNQNESNSDELQQKENTKKENNDDSLEFEFRHKSIFEYFAARAMKFDFDLYKEDIHKLSQEQLRQFGVNQKLIMVSGYNKSEQQVLIKLSKLIYLDNQKADCTKNYMSDDLASNNRYFQYIKRSTIDSYDQINSIDTGSSNLLSALLLSKFAFDKLILRNCSLSKLYNPNHKYIIFDQCNLKHAYISETNFIAAESSLTDETVFDELLQVFGTDNVHYMKQIAFSKNSLISVNLKGYVNHFNILPDQEQCKLVKSKRITCAPLHQIKVISDNQIIVRGQTSLFLLNTNDFSVQKTKTFYSELKHFDYSNNQMIVQLNNSDNYLGNFEQGFQKISIEGDNSKLSNKCDLIITSSKNDLVVYKKNNEELLKSQTLTGHQDLITIIIFSADGKYLATGSADNSCKIWNAENEFQLLKSLEGHTRTISTISFSVDGKYLATCSQDYSCKLWDVIKGFQLLTTIENELKIPIISSAFSSDGKYLATASGGQRNICRIFSVEKGFEKVSKVENHTDIITSLALSENNKYLVTGSEDCTLKIWISPNKSNKGFEPFLTLRDHSGKISSIAFTKDSKFLATSSMDNTCKVWNVDQGFQLVTSINHENGVHSVAFSSNGKLMATGCFNNTPQIWNVEKGFELSRTLQGHTDTISSVTFSQNGKYLASASWDKSCIIWDAQQEFSLMKTLIGHTKKIIAISFSADSKYLATTSLEETCKIWSVEQDFSLLNAVISHSNNITSLAFSLNSKCLATGSYDRTCKVWNVEKGFELMKQVENHNNGALTRAFSAVSFSADSKYLVTGSEDKTCSIWDLEKGFEVMENTTKTSRMITELAFTPDDKYLISGSSYYSFKVWDVEKGFQLINTIYAHQHYLTSLSISSDSKYLATVSWDQTCKIWSINNEFQLFKTINESYMLKAVAFSPDSKTLAICSDQYSTIYQVEKGFELIKTLKGHTKELTSVAFSANGLYLATCSEDMSCMIWDTKKDYKLIQTIRVSDFYQQKVSFTPNGNFLAIRAPDNTCKIWERKEEWVLVQTIQNIKSSLGTIRSIAFTANGKYMATHYINGICKVWNTEGIFEDMNELEVDKSNESIKSVSQVDRWVRIQEVENTTGFECLYIL